MPLGWSWADPVAGLLIAGIAVREGINAWRGETCCAQPIGRTAARPAGTAAAIDDRGAPTRARTWDLRIYGPTVSTVLVESQICCDSMRYGSRGIPPILIELRRVSFISGELAMSAHARIHVFLSGAGHISCSGSHHST